MFSHTEMGQTFKEYMRKMGATSFDIYNILLWKLSKYSVDHILTHAENEILQN